MRMSDQCLPGPSRLEMNIVLCGATSPEVSCKHPNQQNSCYSGSTDNPPRNMIRSAPHPNSWVRTNDREQRHGRRNALPDDGRIARSHQAYA